jgi:hypothetical protein
MCQALRPASSSPSNSPTRAGASGRRRRRPGRRPAVIPSGRQDPRLVGASKAEPARRPPPEQEDSLRSAVRAAWNSLRRQGLIAPELPSILFVGIACWTGFWWGLGAGALAVVVVLAVRLRRALPARAVLGGAVGLAVAATIAHQTGVAASGLLSDICIDLSLAVVLAGSVAVRRPLFGVLWSLVRRQALLRQADRSARRGYTLTTGIAAVALALRSLTLSSSISKANRSPGCWPSRSHWGCRSPLSSSPSAYAAGGLSGHNRATGSAQITQRKGG